MVFEMHCSRSRNYKDKHNLCIQVALVIVQKYLTRK